VRERRMRWAGHVACMGEKWKQVLVGNLKVRDHLEDLGVDGKILNQILKEMRWEGWIYLAYDKIKWWALENMVMNLHVPYNVNFGKFFRQF
jgi:hypothetical protein